MASSTDQVRCGEQRKQNRRTALILASIVAVFFIGIMVRKVFEPSILNLVN